MAVVAESQRGKQHRSEWELEQQSKLQRKLGAAIPLLVFILKYLICLVKRCMNPPVTCLLLPNNHGVEMNANALSQWMDKEMLSGILLSL